MDVSGKDLERDRTDGLTTSKRAVPAATTATTNPFNWPGLPVAFTPEDGAPMPEEASA